MVGSDEDFRKRHLKAWPDASGYFRNGDFFLRFAKKYTSTRGVFESFSSVHMKTLNRACGMLVVNDVFTISTSLY